MADLSKLKRSKSLGAPPPPEDASTVLQEPEVAPAPVPPPAPAAKRIDGRTLRKTGRTIQFATRVSPEWDRRFRAAAERDGITLGQLLELALSAYEERHK